MERVRAIMIVEIAGRPAEHVLESLKAHIGQLKNLKMVRLISETYSEPKKFEGAEEMYTCFAEVEVETQSFLDMVNLVFDFMPSSFEIIEPQNISMNLSDATTMLNTLSGRLHKYDEIAKIAQFQVQQMGQKLQMIQQQKPAEDKNIEKVPKGKKAAKKDKKSNKK
jgi:hypothetical protein